MMTSHTEINDFSSSSDDEVMEEIEVRFSDRTPYRRKSSMVVHEPVRLFAAQSSPNKAQFLVHKSIEPDQELQNYECDSSDTGTLHHSSPRIAPNAHPELCHSIALPHRPNSEGLPSSESANKNANQQPEEQHLCVPHADSHGPASPPTSPLASPSIMPRSKRSLSRSLRARPAILDVQPDELKLVASTIEHDNELFNSRLLTKNQLREMACGVRDLSRRLGAVCLKFRIKTIFILTKIYDRDLVPKTRELVKWLLSKDRETKYTVYVQQDFKNNNDYDEKGLVAELAAEYVAQGGSKSLSDAQRKIESHHRHWEESMCRTSPEMFDLVITLGGDGTVLYASWLFQRVVPPVLSFSLGSLGFLTKFDFDTYQDTLKAVVRHGVNVSLRLRFEGTIMRSEKLKLNVSEKGCDGTDSQTSLHHRDLVEELIGEEKEDERTHRPDGTYKIINEIVVDRGPNPTMSCTEIFGDDEHFTSVMADGVCVSTPTGSTAYNLAAGGSLCHPDNPVMLVTAICPHTLSFRPIILPDTIVLRIGVPYDARASSWASFDGRERVELFPGDYVTISASRFPFATVTPYGRSSQGWVGSIQHKFGWNTRQKQKAFQ